MSDIVEEMRFVADLARSEGELKANYDYLKKENDRLLKEQAMKDKVIAAKDQRIAELELILQQMAGQQTVVVNQYFMLSILKTCNYVRKLNNDGRQFLGHFMHQTLPDNTPLSVIAQVDEMTRLQGNTEARLADAIEELAKQPTTQNIYGDKNEFMEDSQMVKVSTPEGADPVELAKRLTDQQPPMLD